MSTSRLLSVLCPYTGLCLSFRDWLCDVVSYLHRCDITSSMHVSWCGSGLGLRSCSTFLWSRLRLPISISLYIGGKDKKNMQFSDLLLLWNFLCIHWIQLHSIYSLLILNQCMWTIHTDNESCVIDILSILIWHQCRKRPSGEKQNQTLTLNSVFSSSSSVPNAPHYW